MRRLAILTMLAACVVSVAVSCGGSDTPGSSSPTVTGASASRSLSAKSIAAQLSGSKLMDSQQATCVADRVASKLSAGGRKLSNSPAAMAELSGADQKLLIAGVDACVTSAQLAPALAQGLTSGVKLPAATASCLTQKLVAKYPQSGDLFAAMLGKTGQMDVVSLMSACVPGGLGVPVTTG